MTEGKGLVPEAPDGEGMTQGKGWSREPRVVRGYLRGRG